MAGRADTSEHLKSRKSSIVSTFDAWGQSGLSAGDRTAIVESYFHDANVGIPQRVSKASVLVKARRTATHLPTVLVLGRHQTHDLADRIVNEAANCSVGPGLASRLGATIAFCEGVQAAAAVVDEEPLNVTYLSLGDGDTYNGVLSKMFTGNFEAVLLTDALHWVEDKPLLTVGCRGQILAEITLRAGADISDYGVSGALRNPLTKMMQLLASLRDDRGRITLSDFYARANRPDHAVLESLKRNSIQGDEWLRSIPIAAFGGNRSSLERATMWPGLSLLGIETSAADGVSSPGVVRATLALYLIPDQRHAEVERSLRQWLTANAPAALEPELRILDSARPFRSDTDSMPVRAQRRALHRLFGREPSAIPAGGAAGTGEVAYSFDVPVAYAGLAAPGESIGTTAEQLSWSAFERGVERAAETSLEMRSQ